MSLSQRLDGKIEPNDPSWRLASPDDRRWFYDQAGTISLARLQTQLLRGVGANGRLMPPRRQAVLPGGFDGPVMIPRYVDSRAISLSAYQASSRSLMLYWKPGLNHPEAHAARARHTRKHLKHLGGKGQGSRGGGKASPFGDILEFHQQGLVPHAPVRDVRLSAASIAQIKGEVAKRWHAHVADRTPAPPPAPQPQPRPSGPAPTPPREAPPGIAASPSAVPLPVHPGGGIPVTAKAIAPHAVPMQHAPLPVHGAIPHAVPLRPVATTPAPVVPTPRPSPGVVHDTVSMTPRPVSMTTPPATLAAVEQATGIAFAPSEPARGRDVTVIVDAARLDAALAADAEFHVGPGGTGAAKPGGYANAQAFLAKAREGGTPVDMPRLGLAADGTPTVVDGRHRLAALLDAGVRFVPVTVPKSSAARFRQLFGG